MTPFYEIAGGILGVAGVTMFTLWATNLRQRPRPPAWLERDLAGTAVALAITAVFTSGCASLIAGLFAYGLPGWLAVGGGFLAVGLIISAIVFVWRRMHHAVAWPRDPGPDTLPS